MTQNPDAMKEHIDTFDYIKNNFGMSKNIVTKYLTIDKPGENICDITVKEVIRLIYKELLRGKRPRTQSKMTQTIHKNDVKMALQHMKTCLTSLIIRETQLTKTNRNIIFHISMAKIKKYSTF